MSKNAKDALERNKLGRSFWRRWDAVHTDLVRKRQGNICMNRALNCTITMARNHLDELADELINTGIFQHAKKCESGVWEGSIDTSRIFNHDETPQFVNYGIDGTPSGLIYAGRGDPCQKMLRENRECVTIHPFVSFSGDICLCHVIFQSKGITSHMAPEKAVKQIPDLLVSSTESGYQDGKSLLDSYKTFDKYLTKHNVERPVVILSDGHSSRFNDEVLRILRLNLMFLFLGPPFTTSVTQMLDQVNQALHSRYREVKNDVFTPHCTINREGFMTILADVWSTWATSLSLQKAGKRVGISTTGLSVEWMQKEKFAQAEAVIEQEIPPPSTPTSSRDLSIIESPADERRGSAAYYKKKFLKAQKIIGDLQNESITLEEIPGLLKVSKVKPKETSKNTRLTQVCGSMEGKKVLELTEQLKIKKVDQDQARMAAGEKKRMDIEAFFKCKDKCVCLKPSGKCNATKLKECPVCHNILRSVCSKASCKSDDGKKPEMVIPFCQKSTRGLKRKLVNEYDTDESDDENVMEGMADNETDEDEDHENDEEDIFDEEDHLFEDHENSKGGINDNTEDGEIEELADKQTFKTGDYVKIIKGNYAGMFATVIGESYGDEIEIEYFEKKNIWWVLKPGDKDSREYADLQKLRIDDVHVDGRSHVYFK